VAGMKTPSRTTADGDDPDRPAVNVRKTFWMPDDDAAAFQQTVNELHHATWLDKSVVIGALLQAAIDQKDGVLTQLRAKAAELGVSSAPPEPAPARRGKAAKQ